MKKSLFIIGVFLCILTGCAQFEEPIQENQEPESITASGQTRSGGTPVFETLENPYSLSRMRRLTGNNSLQPTDLYVRFLPQDSTQLNLLENVLELDLFDYPLDVNIEEDEEYVDPTIPEGEFTWQYTAVPANFVFPAGCNYQILEQC